MPSSIRGAIVSALLLPLFLSLAPSLHAATPDAPKAVVVNSALKLPWGMAFLPDGRALIAQRAGTMVVLSADGQSVSEPLTGLPPVAFTGMGGLLDVAIDPDFAADPWVYWTYSEPGSGADAGKAGIAVARGRLRGNALENVAVIFRQHPKVDSPSHWGSRLAFRADRTLFVVLGDRKLNEPDHVPTEAAFAAQARALLHSIRLGARSPQSLQGHLGKTIRINRDGSVPAGNPDFHSAGAQPEIWSLGHRNPQGATVHPVTGELWVVEHGPQGGDELNRVLPGRNYGWPMRSYGCPYGAPIGEACRIGGGTHAPRYEEPVATWVPTSIAPSGLAFYTGEQFPEWKGDLFIGALGGTALWRVKLDGANEVSRERLFAELKERIRCVTQGPDGWLYLLTDAGKLIRVSR